jgi:hypothetical protein
VIAACLERKSLASMHNLPGLNHKV